MFDDELVGGKLVLEHGLEELGARSREGIGGFVANQFFKRSPRGKNDTVFLNEPAETAAIALVSQRAGEKRKMNGTPRFVPGAERAGGDILADAFFSAPQEGEFPVMNGAGAVGGQVSDPAFFE